MSASEATEPAVVPGLTGRATSDFFTYVAVDAERRPCPVPDAG
jgi:acyl-CoA hydrolase